jgi:8-amino-7-oxononanoate synthase
MIAVNEMEQQLMLRSKMGNLRSLRHVDNLIDFASNDYLGLARSANFKLAILNEWENIHNQRPFIGNGSTGSRLLTGNSIYAEEVENSIARFHGFETALLFNCGYMANVGLLSAVASKQDIILYDTHVHASTHDGIRLSKAISYPFRHNDIEHLEKRLKSTANKSKRFVCVESIYSIDGTIAPLEEICHLCQKYEAALIVDEAHAVGIFENAGRGLISQKKLEKYVFAQVITFGKALGCHGAAVLGSSLLKEYLVNFCRSFIYTTALSACTLAAIKCAYATLPKLIAERNNLHRVISIYQEQVHSKNVGPIQPVQIKGNVQVRELSQFLALNGFDVRAIMSPTVKRGDECLRICLHSYNTEKEVRELISLIHTYQGST